MSRQSVRACLLANYLRLPQPFLVPVTRCNEQHQVELLGRFKDEGLKCKAVLA
jgi:hypothetical protein